MQKNLNLNFIIISCVRAVQKIAAKAAELYDEMYRKNEPIAVSTMSELLKVRPDDYRDADIPDQLPREMKFDPYVD